MDDMRVFKYSHWNSQWCDSYGQSFYYIHAYPSKEDPLQLTAPSGIASRSCREYFSMDLAESFTKKDLDNAYKKAYALVTTGKTHESAKSIAWWLDNLKNSVVILNAFERHYNIPQTRLYPVVCKNWATKAFLIGPKRYTHSRYAFSLWTLFFRIGYTPLFNVLSTKELLPKMKWPEMYDRIIRNSFDHSILQQARAVFPHMDEFFEFEKVYFKQYTRQEVWKNSLVTSSGVGARPEGIMKLVTGRSYVPKFKDAWERFINGEKI